MNKELAYVLLQTLMQEAKEGMHLSVDEFHHLLDTKYSLDAIDSCLDYLFSHNFIDVRRLESNSGKDVNICNTEFIITNHGVDFMAHEGHF